MHIEVEGDTLLSDALEEAGYELFSGIAQNATQFLNYTDEPVYIHFLQNGASIESGKETDGLPICTDTAVAPAPFFNVERGCRFANTRLYSASPVTIKVEII